MPGRDRKGILVVDDHPIVRKGLIQLINDQEDMVACGEAEDAYQAMSAIKNQPPDLVIVDISLKGISGVDLIENISRNHPNLPVLVVSMHDESLYAERVFRAGARGYVMKQEDDEIILDAARRVLGGGVWISETMAQNLVLHIAQGKREDNSSPAHILTNRELEVFGLIGEGLETRQIAEKLCRSIKTIETYRARVKKKLGIKTNTQLVQRAVEWVLKDTDKP